MLMGFQGLLEVSCPVQHRLASSPAQVQTMEASLLLTMKEGVTQPPLRMEDRMSSPMAAAWPQEVAVPNRKVTVKILSATSNYRALSTVHSEQILSYLLFALSPVHSHLSYIHFQSLL